MKRKIKKEKIFRAISIVFLGFLFIFFSSRLVYNYILENNGYGFTLNNGKKYDKFDLIKEGMYKIEDVPDELLNREKNKIQKEVTVTGKPYINYEKIRDGINSISYPIYHLDFETFPSPLPRFRGEKCYTQSVFQFSLHI